MILISGSTTYAQYERPLWSGDAYVGGTFRAQKYFGEVSDTTVIDQADNYLQNDLEFILNYLFGSITDLNNRINTQTELEAFHNIGNSQDNTFNRSTNFNENAGFVYSAHRNSAPYEELDLIVRSATAQQIIYDVSSIPSLNEYGISLRQANYATTVSFASTTVIHNLDSDQLIMSAFESNEPFRSLDFDATIVSTTQVELGIDSGSLPARLHVLSVSNSQAIPGSVSQFSFDHGGDSRNIIWQLYRKDDSDNNQVVSSSVSLPSFNILRVNFGRLTTNDEYTLHYHNNSQGVAVNNDALYVRLDNANITNTSLLGWHNLDLISRDINSRDIDSRIITAHNRVNADQVWIASPTESIQLRYNSDRFIIRSAKDIYIDPTFGDAVAHTQIWMATTVRFRSHLGDKIRYFDELYKTSVTDLTLNQHSDFAFKWHTDTVDDLMELNEDAGLIVNDDIRSTNIITAGDHYQFDSPSIGLKFKWYGDAYTTRIESFTKVETSDRSFKWDNEERTAPMTYNADSSILSVTHIDNLYSFTMVADETADATSLKDDMQINEFRLWRPSGGPISFVERSPEGLHVQNLIAYSDRNPNHLYLFAIRPDDFDQIFLVRGGYVD